MSFTITDESVMEQNWMTEFYIDYYIMVSVDDILYMFNLLYGLDKFCSFYA